LELGTMLLPGFMQVCMSPSGASINAITHAGFSVSVGASLYKEYCSIILQYAVIQWHSVIVMLALLKSPFALHSS